MRLLTLSACFHSLMTSLKDVEGQVRQTEGFCNCTVCDDLALHLFLKVTELFPAHPRMVSLFLPPYSPFLNSIPHEGRMIAYPSLMHSMPDVWTRLIRHAERFFPRCIARADGCSRMQKTGLTQSLYFNVCSSQTKIRNA